MPETETYEANRKLIGVMTTAMAEACDRIWGKIEGQDLARASLHAVRPLIKAEARRELLQELLSDIHDEPLREDIGDDVDRWDIGYADGLDEARSVIKAKLEREQ